MNSLKSKIKKIKLFRRTNC